MSAAEDLAFEPDRDKLSEEEMAARLGITFRALQTRRLKKKIPHGVWNKINGDVIYSVKRYEAWLESTWDCPPELNLLGAPSASASPGQGQPRRGAAKPSPIRKRPRGSKLPPPYVLT
ncbi:hypothetical protein D9M70_526720 [compost metagenome]